MDKSKNQKNMLIIDDNYNIHVFSDVFEMHGFVVEFATNLADAFYLLKNHETKNFNIILLDLSMNPQYLPEEIKGRVSNDMFAGWTFYLYVLMKKYPALAEQTIFITGYINEFTEWYLSNNQEQDNNMVLQRIIRKDDVKIIDKLLQYCKKYTRS